MTRKEEKIKAGRDFIARNYGKEIPILFAFEAGFDEADEHQKNPWISVSDRLPDDDSQILLSFNGRIRVGEYSPVEEVFNAYGFGIVRVEYWMPIPELPKGGEV